MGGLAGAMRYEQWRGCPMETGLEDALCSKGDVLLQNCAGVRHGRASRRQALTRALGRNGRLAGIDPP